MRKYHAYLIHKEYALVSFLFILSSLSFFVYICLNMDEYVKSSIDSGGILLNNGVTENNNEKKTLQLQEPRLERTMGVFSGAV